MHSIIGAKKAVNLGIILGIIWGLYDKIIPKKSLNDTKRQTASIPYIMRNYGILQNVAKRQNLCSSPVTRTISSIHKGFDFMNTRFFILIRFYVRSRFSPAPFVTPFSARLNIWSRHLFGYRRRYSICETLRVSPHTLQSDNR